MACFHGISRPTLGRLFQLPAPFSFLRQNHRAMANAAAEAPGPPLTPKCGGTGGRGFLWGPQGRAWACQTPAEAQRGAPGRVVAEVFYLAGFAMPGAHEMHSRWPSEVDSTTLGPSPMVPLDNPTPHTAGGCGRKAPGIMLFHQQPNKNRPGNFSSPETFLTKPTSGTDSAGQLQGSQHL